MILMRVLVAAIAVAPLVEAQNTSQPPEFDFGFKEEESVDGARAGFSLPIHGNFTLEAAHAAGANPRWHEAGPAATFVGDWNGRFGQLFGEAALRYNQAFRWESDPESVIDARSLEGVVRELFWKKSFDRWSMTVGNAIVVWGEGDILTPSDVVSRRDTSRLLFEYPAQSRLGQNVVQLSFFPGSGDQLDFLVVPQALSDRLAPAGHPDAMFGMAPFRSSPSENGVELGAKWSHRFARGELAVHGGYFHERRGMFHAGAMSLERSVPGYGLMGVSGHRSLGPIVWRGELAFHKSRAHQRWSPAGPVGYARRDLLTGLIAADVSSSRWGRVSFELGLSSGNPYAIRGLESGLRTSLAANWLRSFLRDSLRAEAAVVWQDGFENLAARTELGYRLDDAWELAGKLTAVDDGMLWGNFARQTRIELDVRYSFDLAGDNR